MAAAKPERNMAIIARKDAGMTNAAVSAEFGISASRVRQIWDREVERRKPAFYADMGPPSPEEHARREAARKAEADRYAHVPSAWAGHPDQRSAIPEAGAPDMLTQRARLQRISFSERQLARRLARMAPRKRPNLRQMAEYRLSQWWAERYSQAFLERLAVRRGAE